jgi:transcriptional regulator with XRE-family HTH domain
MIMVNVAEALKEERTKQHLSQNKLAKLSGVSRSYIDLIEKGKRGKNISPTKLIQLANALNISPRVFLEAVGLKYDEDLIKYSAKNLKELVEFLQSKYPEITDLVDDVINSSPLLTTVDDTHGFGIDLNRLVATAIYHFLATAFDKEIVKGWTLRKGSPVR